MILTLWRLLNVAFLSRRLSALLELLLDGLVDSEKVEGPEEFPSDEDDTDETEVELLEETSVGVRCSTAAVAVVSPHGADSFVADVRDEADEDYLELFTFSA